MDMSHGKSWVMVLGRRDAVPERVLKVVDVTSRSKEKWTHQLSPFFLGPCALYDGHTASKMENAWQYCKVYESHLDNEGNPSGEYWKWATDGWNNKKAVRFPFGRGAKPEYSLWKGQHLGYIEARMRIYAPIYATAVQQTDAWKRLKTLYEKARREEKFLVLLDFDGHNSQETLGSYQSILYNHKMIMGHAFVLAMLLDNQKVWEAPYQEELVHMTKVSLRKDESPEISKTTIFVQNIHPEATDDQFKELFQELNPVRCFIARNRQKKSKEFGFVELESEELQQRVLGGTFTILGKNLTLSPSYIKPQ